MRRCLHVKPHGLGFSLGGISPGGRWCARQRCRWPGTTGVARCGSRRIRVTRVAPWFHTPTVVCNSRWPDQATLRLSVSNLSPASYGYPLRITAINSEFEHGGRRLGNAGHGAAAVALAPPCAERSGEGAHGARIPWAVDLLTGGGD
jgi:hypothetical protein